MQQNDRPYWNMEVEPYLNTPKMKEIQLENLKRFVSRAYEKSNYQNRRFNKLGLKPENIQSLEDYQKAISPMTKDDVRNELIEYMGEVGPKGALEGFLCAPFEKVVLMASTSGSTGEPTPYFFTQEDIRINSESISRAFWRSGVRPNHVVLHAMALSMFAAGVPAVEAIQNFGACVIPMGAEAGTERLLSFARLYSAILGIDAIICTPSFAEYLVDKAESVLGDKISSLGIKTVFCGGEPGAGIPEVRKKIEEGFGARVYDAMGLGPIIWASCNHQEYQGMHYLTEDMSLLELVDPETKEAIKMEDGVSGALVLTPLKGEGLTVMRHIVGDVGQIFLEKCLCGQTGMRIKVLGRIDDMLKVKGVLVYPAAIDSVITSFIPKVTGEFRILLDEPPPRVKPPLKLKVEYGSDIKADMLDRLANEISDKMHDRIRIRPLIHWIPPMTLERSVHKTRFIEKTYEKGTDTRIVK